MKNRLVLLLNSLVIIYSLLVLFWEVSSNIITITLFIVLPLLNLFIIFQIYKKKYWILKLKILNKLYILFNAWIIFFLLLWFIDIVLSWHFLSDIKFIIFIFIYSIALIKNIGVIYKINTFTINDLKNIMFNVKLSFILNVLVLILLIYTFFLDSIWNSFFGLILFLTILLANIYYIKKIYNNNFSKLWKINNIIIKILLFSNFVIIFLMSLWIINELASIHVKEEDVLRSFLILLNSLFFISIIFKNLNITLIMFLKKMLKILKWLFIIFITWFAILLIAVYLSSLNSYKESDFNIPKDFFITKFWDRDLYSEKNWFEDFVKFNELLEKTDLEYFDIESKCIFDKEKIREWECEERKKRYFTKFLEEHDKEIDKEISVLKRKSIEVLWKYENHQEILSNEEENNYNEYFKEKNNLINKKYIKLEANKIYLLKQFYSYFSIVDLSKEIQITNDKLKELKPTDVEFYKVFDYINDKKVYGRYKEFVDNINKIDENIKTIADVWKTIDKINNWIYIEQKTKDIIKEEIRKLFSGNLELSDFKIYNKSIREFEEQKNRIIEKQFKKLRNFVAVNKLKYKKIDNKEYILPTSEYTNINGYWNHKSISYWWLIRYTRLIRYVAYKYFEKWKYEQWIDLLLNFQIFIDNLTNKTDWNILTATVYITIQKYNLNMLSFVLDNYDLSEKLKEKIKNVLKEKINKWLIINWLKYEHNEARTIFQWLYDESLKRNKDEWLFSYYLWIITTFLFYSVDETEVLADKTKYDYISSLEKDYKNTDFKFPKNVCVIDESTWERTRYNFSFNNLNNYIWRLMVCWWWSIDTSKLQKEQDIHDLRNKILEKLK